RPGWQNSGPRACGELGPVAFSRVTFLLTPLVRTFPVKSFQAPYLLIPCSQTRLLPDPFSPILFFPAGDCPAGIAPILFRTARILSPPPRSACLLVPPRSRSEGTEAAHGAGWPPRRHRKGGITHVPHQPLELDPGPPRRPGLQADAVDMTGRLVLIDDRHG